MYTYAQNYSMFYSPYAHELFIRFAPLIAVALIWTIIIKGYALWYAARNSQKGWFIALLIINTVGILELIYLIWFRPTSTPHTPGVSSSIQA